MKKKISLILLASLISVCGTVAAPNYSYTKPVQTYQNYYPAPLTQNSQQSTLKGRVVTVPAGQSLSTQFTAPVSSKDVTTGQQISIALSSDFCYRGNLIAPAGSAVVGSVIEVSKAKHGSMNGKLCLRFNQIVTPYGLTIPISAVIKTSDNSGVLVGGTKMDVTKEYGKDLVIGSAAGALSGLVFGALAGGSVGQGAALGTAVGAGGGLVKSAIDKGKDVEIPAGATVEIVLTQPVTTTPSAYDYEN